MHKNKNTMTGRLNPILQGIVEDALRGNLSVEQVRKCIEEWPACTQRELREQSDALLILSVISRSSS